LDADPLEPELVERDDSVDPAIPGLPHSLEIVVARPVAQSMQEVEHQLLEEHRWGLRNLLQKFCGDRATNLL
jgi:hypothetical protein